MKKWLRIGICLVLAVSLLVLPACKKSQPATEATGSNQTEGTTATTPSTPSATEPEETIPADIAYYQILYPQCADLSLEDGLEISIWHRASGEGAGYYCDFLPERDAPYELYEAYELGQKAVPMEIMRKIVGYYIDSGAITKEQVTLKCVDMPSSSVNDYKASYIEGHIGYYFWADEAIFKYVNIQSHYDGNVYYMVKGHHIKDLATFDIDGDGAQEQIALFFGRWNAHQCIELMVAKNGAAECWNEFDYHDGPDMYWDISLEETGQGTVQLVITEKQYIDAQTGYLLTGQVYRFDLGVSDGNVVILGDTEKLFTYSNGGVDSIPWPKQ